MTRNTSNPTLALILKRQRWNVRDAEVVLSTWRESGDPASRFAERHGLVAERILRWRRRLSSGTLIRLHPVEVRPRHHRNLL